ncbi:hypothetical protein Nepgr_032151 [Nepenthes gracilis]|uniref:RING-type domain-containing protein n=1 Tax=Nepenthes gracilis TaxID=150966 RepID=A0AAD3TJX5_NEPGR|nr:hypothetical protein Nepgr_032151 [Nepenthes gracilis]
MATGDQLTIIGGVPLHRHVRRQLNHLHQTLNRSSQYKARDDPHLLRWHYAQFNNRNLEIHGQTLFYIFVLFSIILLATLLLLYACWFFRFRHVDSALPQTVDLPPPPPPPPQRGGLEPTVIQTLPIILQQSSATSGVDEMECCICLVVFKDGDKVKELPSCHHLYHSDCVDTWLINHSNCPLCRIAIRVDMPVDSGLV